MPSEATATFEPGLKGISSSLNQMVDGVVMVLNLTIVNIFIPSTLTSPGLIYPTSYSFAKLVTNHHSQHHTINYVIYMSSVYARMFGVRDSAVGLWS
jgi:hypothetical protein